MQYVSSVYKPIAWNTRLSAYCQTLYPREVGGTQ